MTNRKIRYVITNVPDEYEKDMLVILTDLIRRKIINLNDVHIGYEDEL